MMGYGIVDIRKVGSYGDQVAYAFHHEGKAGTFFVDMNTGEISGASFVKTDREARAGFAAQFKVKQAWEAGELPEKLVWAG
ncbi:MAG: hypothetical protein AAGE05_15110 [Pseudomonadota bacterium]